MLEKIKSIIYRLSWVPLILGLIGYVPVGKLPFWDGLYASIALYFLNPVSDIGNVWVLLAKYTAVIVIANVVLEILGRVYRRLSMWYLRRKPDSTAIYGDCALREILLPNLRHGYYADSDERIEKAAEHIFLFSDDMKNLQFYARHRKELQGRKVYLLLNEIDSFLLRNDGGEDVHYFNLNEMMARDYWKQHHLYGDSLEGYRIAIIGFGAAGKAIFKMGYLNNLYSLHQQIEYHIWGASSYDAAFLKDLNCANKDRIVVHEEPWNEKISGIAQMDRVILTEESDMIQTVQQLLYEAPGAHIHCCSKEGTVFESIYEAGNILSFGDMREILTEENIKKENTYLQAKLFNYDYVLRTRNASLPKDYEQDMEQEWRKLNGFTKGSNIARADHYWIEKRLLEEDPSITEEQLQELEHIRWCRFHYANHWTYGSKDKANRRHDLLVPFEELAKTEQQKDGFYCSALKEEVEKRI